VLPDPFRRMGAWRNSTEIQQSGHILRSGCLQDKFFLHLSCIGKKKKEGCDHDSEVETVHSRRDGEGPVPLRKSKESGRMGVAKKILSPKRVAGVHNLCNDQGLAGWEHG